MFFHHNKQNSALNPTFPRSRQGSAQQKDKNPLKHLDNSMITIWNNNRNPPSPFSHGNFNLQTPNSITPSSKKNSISSTTNTFQKYKSNNKRSQSKSCFQHSTIYQQSLKMINDFMKVNQNFPLIEQKNSFQTTANTIQTPQHKRQQSNYYSKQNSGVINNKNSRSGSQHTAIYQQSQQMIDDYMKSLETIDQQIQQHPLKKQKEKPKPVSFLNYIRIQDISNIKSKTLEENQHHMNIKQIFDQKYVIGIGGFGKVWKVENKKTNQFFAMKEMSKALIIAKKSVNSVMNERKILSTLKHPFLVNMYFAFQDRENLYLVLDYLQGGDLRYHIGRMRRFPEEQTKFFIACIIIGLEHMHSNSIIHRDIKPENLVLDKSGYVRITDMGIARIMRPENSQDTSGTPGYMAPEVMCRQNHSFSVDYFALGVIGYEFMMGRRPYQGRSRKEIRDQVLAKQAMIKQSEIPNNWSVEAADFINRLLQRKPVNRLGYGGIQELKNHQWLKSFPWSRLFSKEIRAPFIPPQRDDNFDAKQIYIEDEENNELIQQNILLLRRDSLQSLFSDYQYSVFEKQQNYKKNLTQGPQTTFNPYHKRNHSSYFSN